LCTDQQKVFDVVSSNAVSVVAEWSFQYSLQPVGLGTQNWQDERFHHLDIQTHMYMHTYAHTYSCTQSEISFC